MDQPHPASVSTWQAAITVLDEKVAAVEAELVEILAGAADAAFAAVAGAAARARAALREREAGLRSRLADLGLAKGKAEEKLEAARERERQAAHDELRETGVQLCRQRIEAAAHVDRALMALEASAARWRGLGDALHPVRYELGVPDGIALGTDLMDDAESMLRAIWAMAPGTAGLLGLRPNDARRPLVHADGAGRLAVRLQQRPRRAA
jgi:hypothetical protein